MERLPPHSACFVRPLLATLALSGPAAAQIPVVVAPASAEAEPAPGDALPADPAVPVAPAPTAPAPLPEPPPAPSGTLPPPSASQPSPARADRLKEPSGPADDAAFEDEEDDEEGSSTEMPRRTWYGWQTLTADGISTLLFITAASQSGSGDAGEALVWASLLGYEFAPGIVHFAHKNPGRGFASFGIRLGMPLAGAFVGAAAASGCTGYLCEADGVGVGFLLGMGGAIAIDAAVLAYDYPESRRGTARVRPVVSIAPGRAFVGLSGEL